MSNSQGRERAREGETGGSLLTEHGVFWRQTDIRGRWRLNGRNGWQASAPASSPDRHGQVASLAWTSPPPPTVTSPNVSSAAPPCGSPAAPVNLLSCSKTQAKPCPFHTLPFLRRSLLIPPMCVVFSPLRPPLRCRLPYLPCSLTALVFLSRPTGSPFLGEPLNW